MPRAQDDDEEEKPLVYLILGAAGSGRREVLADLLDADFDPGVEAVVMLSEGEREAPEADGRLGRVVRWRWTAERTIEAELPPTASYVFFVTDGRANPVDQIEVFKPWLVAQGGELARVLCVVNCRLAELNPPLVAWFEACIHFADVVLFNRREGVDNKWLRSFQGRFEDQYLPCLFQLVKGGKVANPALVLEPQARRLSHYLDDEQEWILTDEDGEVIDPDDEEEAEDDEELSAEVEVDPYLELRAGGHRRVKELPDISKFV
jgi:hypothetical protein